MTQGTPGMELSAGEKLVTRLDTGEHLEDLVADSWILTAFPHERRALPHPQKARCRFDPPGDGTAQPMRTP